MGASSFLKRAQALLRVQNQLVRECLAELLAVFVLIVSGARAGGLGAVPCSPGDSALPGSPAWTLFVVRPLPRQLRRSEVTGAAATWHLRERRWAARALTPPTLEQAKVGALEPPEPRWRLGCIPQRRTVTLRPCCAEGSGGVGNGQGEVHGGAGGASRAFPTQTSLGFCDSVVRGPCWSHVPLLQLITLSGSAQKVTSSGTKGNILTADLAGALAVMVAIYTAGGVSGAHLNPAFSFAMCLLEQLPWWKFPIFVAVQTLAAFVSAGAVYALYYDAIQHYSNGTLTTSGPQETASIFATYPADYLSLSNGFLDQVMGTALLIMGILAILDTRNKAVPKGLEPVVVALLVFSIEVSMGSNCGCPMNPARDFGPRLFTYVAGWGAEVFSRGNGWWWVPVVAPLLGAAVGSALYQLLVAFHHPPEEGDPPPAKHSALVLVNAAIPPDIEMAPGEKDAGGVMSQK
ncbi:aquaporin-10 [Strix aluco]|uniref:aquaporin-10 n=1 Tax=Strix aluco TaxID=111821 RepID=UPI003DA3D385